MERSEALSATAPARAPAVLVAWQALSRGQPASDSPLRQVVSPERMLARGTAAPPYPIMVGRARLWYTAHDVWAEDALQQWRTGSRGGR